MKWLRFVAFLFTLLSTAWADDRNNTSVIDGRLLLRADTAQLSRPLLLNGDWHFVPNRWLEPDQLQDASDMQWAKVPGGRQDAAIGIGTFWIDVLVDNDISEPSTLQFHHICGAAKVYFYRDGTTPRANSSAPYNTSNNVLPAPLLNAGQPALDQLGEKISGNNLLANLPPLQPGLYHLLIHQSNFHLREGGLCGSISWGLTSTQAHSSTVDTVKNTVIATMLLSLALGSLILGSQNGERAAPWLALMCTACAVLISINSGLLGALLPPDNKWRGHLDYIGIFSAMIWLPPAILMVFRHTFAIPLPRWLALGNILIPVLLNIGVALSVTVFAQHPQIISVVWCLQTIAAFSVLFSACRRHRQYAWAAVFGSVLVLLATSYDLYRFFTLGIIEILSPYAIAFLAAMHGGIYTLKFGAAYQLAARLSEHLQEEVEIRTRELREKNFNLEQTQNALQRANESLRELSITDGLTRTYNRMYFEQQFEREWRRCARQGLPLSVLMIDADHFKQLNDSAGHLVGDLCLQTMAKEISNHFKRSGEVVARYGGEEFIVLLPDSTQGKALAAAEGLRIAIERLSFSDSNGTSYRVTVSIGVSTTIPGMDQRPEQLIATADAALYEAKDSGRNRVHSIPILGARSAMAQQKLHL